ncbi:alpha/beta fold hydrolase [Paraburkholderia megapolitana]|uniref:alpha/beta fold hydrolase n=1 Tax=Paraburkholderia megapolitana TaxID=420953 RepID=UPI0038B8072F
MADQTVLFLIPGLLCDDSVWQHQAAGLAHIADVRTPDITGFSSIEAMANYILHDAPAVFSLAGHSMGARVALEMYRVAPERIERMALLDTGTHPVRPGEREKRMGLLALARQDGMRALAEQWLPPMVSHELAPDSMVMTSLFSMVERMTPEIFEAQITALLGRRDAAEVLPNIHCPLLVGVGREDVWSPPSQHEDIVAAVPHAQYVIFDNSGHMSPVEAPEAVTAALSRWLS